MKELYNKHYKEACTEPVVLMQQLMTREEFLGFLKGNIIKYSLRAGLKTGESVDKDLIKKEAYVRLLKRVTDNPYEVFNFDEE
jgi:Protein of unknwon function (DUF3310)